MKRFGAIILLGVLLAAFFATALNAQPETGQPAGATAGAEAGAKPDDVVEADYEIVDDKK